MVAVAALQNTRCDQAIASVRFQAEVWPESQI